MKEGLLLAINAVNRLLKVLLVTGFLFMSFLVFIQIIYRYVLLKPIPWSEELARYLFEWCTFLGSSIAVKEKAHVGVEMFVNLLPKTLRKVAAIVSYLGSIIFVGLMTYFGFILVSRTTGQVSAAMRMPMALAYLSIPLGSGFMLLNFLYLLLDEIITPPAKQTV